MDEQPSFFFAFESDATLERGGKMKVQSTGKDRLSLNLTVYQNGFGMIKEVRQITDKEKVDEIHYSDISKNIDETSVLVKGVGIFEQSFIRNPVSKSELLEKYIGREVMVRNRENGEELKIRLLSAVDGLVGEQPDTNEIVIDPSGELVLPPLPEKAFENPALVWKVASGKIEDQIQVSYMAQGIEWRANYIAEIQGTALFLTGWIEIRNDMGIDLSDTTIKLIAGDVYRNIEFSFKPNMLESSMRYPQVAEYQFEDRISYKLERPITLLDGETKQIPFLEANIAAFRTIYEADKWSGHARIKVEFDNKKINGLGILLPRGTMKIYRPDADGELEFIGEDAVGPLTEEETVSILVGKTVNVSCESREKKRWKNEGTEYATYAYDLVNKKEENIRVHICHEIEEPIWEMESSSHDYHIKNRGHIEFIVRMAAKKTATVEFTYRVDKV